MAARSTPPRRGVSGDCAQTEEVARSEPIASATRVTSVIGHLPKGDQAVGLLPSSHPAATYRGLTACDSGTRSEIRRRCYGTLHAGGSDETCATSRGRP